MAHPDGIYFGLPEAEYHEDDALGSTDTKNLIIGAEVYWANTPMNPLFKRTETKCTVFGSAYHKLILEGEEAFNKCYCAAPDKEDYPNALFTTDDLKARLSKHGAKLSGKKSELIARLLEIEPSAQIWDVIQEQFRDENEGREALPAAMIAEIQYTARFILGNPYLKDAFKGGYPEVSIFFTRNGVRCKARVDYLKPSVWIDFKSYSNPFGSRADVAIHLACVRNGHDIQAAWYRPALLAAKTLPAFGDVPDDEWMRAFRKGPEPQIYYIYQPDKGVPMARGKWMHFGLQTFQIAELQCQNALEFYKECVARFGTDPWIIPEKPSSFEDEAMPMFRR